MEWNTEEVLKNLADIVGSQWVKIESADLNRYGKDWTTNLNPKPSAVVLPVSIEEIQAIVLFANERKIPLVPSGGRTGLSGGSVAANHELIVAFDRMNKIMGFNAADRLVFCQPGVITEQLQKFHGSFSSRTVVGIEVCSNQSAD